MVAENDGNCHSSLVLEDARVRGGMVLASVLVAAGLVLELFSLHAPAVGFGVIFGGWVVLVGALVRAWSLRRIRS
ncbi:hypothetical protein [Amnibacterium soli]|uniref:hypothetical protein n=1 Tax=Amnibacterium soli TaxID=1282736 RepID=UPI0031EDB467